MLAFVRVWPLLFAEANHSPNIQGGLTEPAQCKFQSESYFQRRLFSQPQRGTHSLLRLCCSKIRGLVNSQLVGLLVEVADNVVLLTLNSCRG